jgi:ribosomal protein S20
MPSTHKNSQAQAQAQGFISVIFKIVTEMLNTAGIDNQKILLGINRNQSIDSLFRELASQVKNGSTPTTMIHNNQLARYKSRIDAAMLGDDCYIDEMTSESFTRNSSGNGN